ncbi:MAG TPA: Fe-S cluster assembly protein HesB [Kiritimatiellia bacterium]|nr:Fe-S cluster assembly protein HesB [Kiritimatiellia bacterium]
MSARLALPLAGPAGEPVDFMRSLLSHGVADLPPFFIDRDHRALTVTLSLGRSVRTVEITEAGNQRLAIRVRGPAPSPSMQAAIRREVRNILRLDEDLSRFFAVIARDPALAWAASGAGRLIRCQTVFEDVIKTICTTNCAWSATVRMVDGLVRHLGRHAPGAPANTTQGRAFPTPETLADVPDAFYRDTIRAGYRGPYIKAIARDVAEGKLDLAPIDAGHPARWPDDEAEERLLALPGVGPYAAAHILMMRGRYSRLVLDSWTRPTYARLVGRRAVSDAAIQKRFRPHGPFAGLAFWLFVTRNWL